MGDAPLAPLLSTAPVRITSNTRRHPCLLSHCWTRSLTRLTVSSRQLHCRLNIIREKELDPSKAYIFGLHPHGIIVLSRMAWFGGLWAKTFPGVSVRRTTSEPCRDANLVGSADNGTDWYQMLGLCVQFLARLQSSRSLSLVS